MEPAQVGRGEDVVGRASPGGPTAKAMNRDPVRFSTVPTSQWRSRGGGSDAGSTPRPVGEAGPFPHSPHSPPRGRPPWAGRGPLSGWCADAHCNQGRPPPAPRRTRSQRESGASPAHGWTLLGTPGFAAPLALWTLTRHALGRVDDATRVLDLRPRPSVDGQHRPWTRALVLAHFVGSTGFASCPDARPAVAAPATVTTASQPGRTTRRVPPQRYRSRACRVVCTLAQVVEQPGPRPQLLNVHSTVRHDEVAIAVAVGVPRSAAPGHGAAFTSALEAANVADAHRVGGRAQQRRSRAGGARLQRRRTRVDGWRRPRRGGRSGGGDGHGHHRHGYIQARPHWCGSRRGDGGGEWGGGRPPRRVLVGGGGGELGNRQYAFC